MPIVTDQTKVKQAQSFTSWKLDLLNAACMDERLKPATFRLLSRLVEAMDQQTWAKTICEAIIGDRVIQDEIPGFKDRHTLQDHRVALQTTGWLRFEPGSGRRATRYQITDAPSNELLDRRILLREAREADRLAEVGKLHRNRRLRRGETSPKGGDVRPPVHLTLSPHSSLSVEDMTLAEPKPQPCTECGCPSIGKADRFGDTYCAAHIWMAT